MADQSRLDPELADLEGGAWDIVTDDIAQVSEMDWE